MTVRRFTNAELQQFNGRSVDDLISPSTRLMFVGINPGLWTAAVNAHFARGGNRFWPVLHRAGILPRLVDARDGMSADDRSMVVEAGVGITNLVQRASARAAELTAAELLVGGARLIKLVEDVKPAVVAVLGLTAYRQAFAERAAAAGRQDRDLGASELWVLPNPSGLNAHETVATLAAAYRAAAAAAGLHLFVTQM